MWNKVLNFDIDSFLNPFIPANPLNHLPKVISYPLGYRASKSTEPPVLASWSLMVVAIVAGLCLIGGIYDHTFGVEKWHPPTIIASLGASAILNYNTIKSPLAQPRNTIVGHTLSAIVGVGIARLFQLSSNFENIEWVAGAVACAAASLVMAVTNTVHPPGGATAVLASTQSQIISLGWKFPPLILLASVLMITVACIFNNILRQYPTYWWTPEECGQKLRRKPKRVEDVESYQKPNDDHLQQSNTAASERTLTHDSNNLGDFSDTYAEIRIGPLGLHLPYRLELTSRELEVLERLQQKLVACTQSSVV